jgi:uncharacterized protein YlxW (UPF0749 family)
MHRKHLRLDILTGISLLFFAVTFMISGCGPDLQAENEKLKKEVAELTVENEKLKAETISLRNGSSDLHKQVAELNMQISSLQTQNQSLQNEIDAWKKKKK